MNISTPTVQHRADEELIDAIDAALTAAADPAQMPAMQAYMKSTMPYLGVRVPVVRALTFAIDTSATDRDFFIRKAIGWALREYARTEPEWVREFVQSRELSPLSRWEALKHLQAR